MKRKPIISVVMPCFNCERFLDYSIRSIINQSFVQFEFIIINDGSTDNSDLVVKQYLSDGRLRYYEIDNSGNYSARNYGMELAGGKYVCVMDADDIAHIHRLNTQYKYLEENKDIGCLGSQAFYINTEGIEIGVFNRPCSSEQLKIFLLKDNFVIHPSVMFRRNILQEEGISYDARLKYAADYDFILKFTQCSKVANIEERLVYYRKHENQISRLKSQEMLMTVQKVRLKQLATMNVYLSKINEDLYNRFLQYEKLTEREFEKIVIVVNEILEANEKYKIYNKKLLYDFFENELINSQSYSL